MWFYIFNGVRDGYATCVRTPHYWLWHQMCASGAVCYIAIIIMQRYISKIHVNAITRPRTATVKGRRAALAALADNFVYVRKLRIASPAGRPAIRNGDRGVATPSALCISSIRVAVSGTDPRHGVPLCTEVIRGPLLPLANIGSIPICFAEATETGTENFPGLKLMTEEQNSQSRTKLNK